MLGLVVVGYNEYDYFGGEKEQDDSTPVASAALILGSLQSPARPEY